MKCDYLSTTDYSQFKFFSENRPVTPCRVQALKESIAQVNKLHLYPIIVNRDKYVVDGQHRLTAAKSLRIPIYYVVDDDSTTSDMILFNTHRTNWSLENYVNFHNQNGLESFVFFQEMYEFAKTQHSTFTPVYRALIVLCCGSARTFPDLIRSGKLILKNTHLARKFIEITFPICRKLNNDIKNLRTKKSPTLFFKMPYINTLAFCFKKMNDKQYKELLGCLERDVSKFSDTNSHTEVYNLFKNSYCFNKKKEKLKFDFNFDAHKVDLEKTHEEESK